MSPVVIGLVAVVLLQSVLLGVALRLYRREYRANRQRRVEAPNSAHRSAYVVDMEARERWESIDLERLHELNREEVSALLGKARATGVKSLTGLERAFLDRMADAHDRVGEAALGGPATASGHLPRPS